MDGDDEVNGKGWEMVAVGPSSIAAAAPSYTGDDFSIFPPSLHEGLIPTLTLTLDGSTSTSTSPSTSICSPSSSSTQQFGESIQGLEENKQEEKEDMSHVTRTPVPESARRLVDLVIELIRSKISIVGGGSSKEGGAVWSFAALAGVAGLLMYTRWRHRRQKELLQFLLSEKDQRIDQLMKQIVQMSEIVASIHKVPVLKKT